MFAYPNVLSSCFSLSCDIWWRSSLPLLMSNPFMWSEMEGRLYLINCTAQFILCYLLQFAATFPLDLVRRRKQLEGAGGRARVYTTGLLGVFKHILRTEGFSGFYRGILPEYYKVVPGVGICFMTYETLKSLLADTNARLWRGVVDGNGILWQIRKKRRICWMEGTLNSFVLGIVRYNIFPCIDITGFFLFPFCLKNPGIGTMGGEVVLTLKVSKLFGLTISFSHLLCFTWLGSEYPCVCLQERFILFSHSDLYLFGH